MCVRLGFFLSMCRLMCVVCFVCVRVCGGVYGHGPGDASAIGGEITHNFKFSSAGKEKPELVSANSDYLH